MNISKQSLHYRFLKSLDKEIPNGLCEYVRMLISTIFCIAFIISIILFMSFISGSFTLSLFDITTITPFGFVDVVLAAVLGFVGWLLIVLAFVGLMLAGETLLEKKANSVTFNYIKAKKSKICPRIEFKD